MESVSFLCLPILGWWWLFTTGYLAVQKEDLFSPSFHFFCLCLSLCLSLFVSLFLSLSFSLFVCLSLSVFVSVSFVSLFLPTLGSYQPFAGSFAFYHLRWIGVRPGSPTNHHFHEDHNGGRWHRYWSVAETTCTLLSDVWPHSVPVSLTVGKKKIAQLLENSRWTKLPICI